MNRSWHLFTTVFVILFVTLTAQASTTFTARLTGTQETPPTGATATGTGTVVLNDAQDTITYTLTFSGLGSPQSLAHIHAPAAPGATAAPLIDIGSNGQTADTFSGSSPVTAQQVADLKGGLWYFNVHSQTFPNGEIRGQIQPSFLISEFRFRGLAGGNDEFIEIYNNSDASVTVSVSDGSAGWALAGSNTTLPTPAISARFIIPNGTVIPPRGRYLGTNSGAAGYSLAGYPAGGTNAAPTGATGDITYATGVIDGGSIGLFRTSTLANFTDGFRLDAVGFTAPAGGTASFIEGGGLTPAGGITTTGGENSFVRRQLSGRPQDTDNNQNDFDFVGTTGGIVTRAATLGAPGPENLSSPIQRNNQIKATLIEPQNSSNASPNRVRDLTVVPNGAQGTLDIRRRFTNNTGGAVTRLRFRIVDLTTLAGGAVPVGQADIRVLNGTDLPIVTSLGSLTVQGTTVETPPAQASGGGLNSSVTFALPGALAAGATVDLHFLLGVQTNGSYRIFINVEALPAPPGAPNPAKVSDEKPARSNKRPEINSKEHAH